MEGKPRFFGNRPESNRGLSQEVLDRQEQTSEGTGASQNLEVNRASDQQFKTEAPIQPTSEINGGGQLTHEAESSLNAAINEALTDSKVDISAVQAMMEHLFEENNKDV
jgi:hypothetical protein